MTRGSPTSDSEFGMDRLAVRVDEVWSAIRRLDRGRRTDPGLHNILADAYAKLGMACFRDRSYVEAIEAFEGCLRFRPERVEVLSNLGAAYSLAGQAAMSEACLRRAIRLSPGFLPARSNLLLSLNYGSKATSTRIASEHRVIGRAWDLPGVDPPPQSGGTRRRKWRIGYVSSDFREHPVARFFAPILTHHDRHRFDVVCYSTAPIADGTTARLRKAADRWRSLASLDDDAAAHAVRQDRCDILIDLNGHTQGNRLGIFARQPAPVQATYLGYPNGTGLRAMQYRLTDAIADPPGMTDHLHTESLVRLPECCVCFRPPTPSTAVQPVRSWRTRGFTFGSLNQYQKISDFTLDLWAQILRAVPGTRLLLQSLSMSDPRVCDLARGRFEQAGIDPGRLELACYSKKYLETYQRIDLALDPFPFHGATTTCDALWMGTPVVSLEGRTCVSRMGTTLLTAVGLEQFIARTPEEYVRIACEWADHPRRLERIRKTLRWKMARSVLRDESGFAGRLEGALVEILRN